MLLHALYDFPLLALLINETEQNAVEPLVLVGMTIAVLVAAWAMMLARRVRKLQEVSLATLVRPRISRELCMDRRTGPGATMQKTAPT